MDAWVVVLIVVVVVLFVLYLSQTAARLDRLHHRVDTSLATLQAQFMDRANEVLSLASSGRLDPSTSVLLADAADNALAQARASEAGFTLARCSAESALTSALEATFTDPQVVDELMEQPDGQRIVNDLTATIQKAAWSRRFHNDAVRATVAVRQQRLVRLLRLAGSATLPHTVELDDEVPPALRTR
ncbi:MAG: hypothetical protein IPN52_03560 [Micrococcales bacterium]|nr:hypothetical protein [Micrococcales bacterium]